MDGKSEDRLAGKVSRAFNSVRSESFQQFGTWSAIPDRWVEENPYIFESIDSENALYLLPRYMQYVLGSFREHPQTPVYINLLVALGEHGKCRDPDLGHLNLRYKMTKSQVAAVVEFLKHLRFNQPANIDEEELDRILRNWSRPIT